MILDLSSAISGDEHPECESGLRFTPNAYSGVMSSLSSFLFPKENAIALHLSLPNTCDRLHIGLAEWRAGRIPVERQFLRCTHPGLSKNENAILDFERFAGLL
jgi:hypothetical protein